MVLFFFLKKNKSAYKGGLFLCLCNLPPSADTGKNNPFFLSRTGKSQSFAKAVTVPDTQLPRKLAEAENLYPWIILYISA